MADLADILTCRPLSTYPDTRTPAPSPSPFSASWSVTTDLLARELEAIGARDAVLELEGVTDQQIRRDGLPYADAKIGRAVVLSFGSRHGPLRYACDRFAPAGRGDHPRAWQHNVRAVALALEALRKVDRYGVTSRGEQYQGWRALPPGDRGPSRGTLEDLWVIARAVGSPVDSAMRTERPVQAAMYRDAMKRTHPDRGGDPDVFRQVREAGERLGLTA